MPPLLTSALLRGIVFTSQKFAISDPMILLTGVVGLVLGLIYPKWLLTDDWNSNFRTRRQRGLFLGSGISACCYALWHMLQ